MSAAIKKRSNADLAHCSVYWDLGASLRSVSITLTMAADGELRCTVPAQSMELRPHAGVPMARRYAAELNPLFQLPLIRPLTRPYRPVWLRCSQLSAVSKTQKMRSPATLTHLVEVVIQAES